MSDVTNAARAALSEYVAVEGVPLAPQLASPQLVRPLGDGLINETFLVELAAPAGPVRAVLQRVNPLFGIAVHDDIEAITSHLAHKGLPTPRLLRTRQGALAVDRGNDGVWRLLSYVAGHSFSQMTPQLAMPAGELVARFHSAVADLDHRFHFVRSGAHDFAKHLRNLRAAYEHAAQKDTPPAAFFPLADAIFALADTIPADVPGPLRICHGDLKINNLRFSDDGRGICLLDLDTLASLRLGLELGDALRSWCSPLGEDRSDAYFDTGLLDAVLRGYAGCAKQFVTVEEREFLVTGTLRIAVQLAARFAADVVNQSYFRFDPTRFASRAAHNLVRAQGQLSLAHSLVAQKSVAESLVCRAFS